MSIYVGNSLRARGRTFLLGRLGHIVTCDEAECEWYSTAAVNSDHAKEIEVNHYRVAHPQEHEEKLWDLYRPKGVPSG